ncbi:MAG: glycosyltransferase family 4 protein [Ruminococcaceae bacterium]|nr:glycosyltransferase family 4 protein [Oscillospiraceae bacterium]
MKICFCIGKLTFSGAENVIRYLAGELIKKGYDVSVVLTGEMPGENDSIEGLTVEGAIVRGSGIKNTVKRILAVRRALKKLRPDVFVIFNFAMAFTAVPAAMFFRKTKVVVCERNDPTSVPPSKKRQKARNFVFGLSDVCVSQTDNIAEYFKDVVKNNVVIPNPIRARGEMCADVSERSRVFATVARLDDYQKNQTMMIRAFASVVKKHPEYELHFLGSGPDLEKYTKLISELGIEDNVRLLGNVAAPLDYIRNCRGFLLSSKYEGMPNALIEAMSIGLPCVSTDCLGGGAAALIADGENGFLVGLNDETAFADRICKLIEDDELCRKLGNSAYEINETLNGEKIVSKWESLFDSCSQK